jgi:PEP-CTERM motif
VQKTLAIALLSGALSISLPAATLSGQFTLVGTVTVTAGGQIEWTSTSNVANEATISSAGTLSGSFAGMGNQTVTVNALTDAPGDQPVNTPFTNFNFIDFTGEPSFPELLANYIPLGSATGTDCSTDVAAAQANQTCTLNGGTNPPAPGGSPFTFLNTETSVNQTTECCTSTATWNISGVTSDGQSVWNGQFTATFPYSYQQVLANFVTNGQVDDAYSGVMVVTLQTSPTSGVPEPTTLAFMGTGVVLLWVGTRRRKKSRNIQA